ncbi:PAS domain-containing protein [Dankookia rubra]|uniref:histidine kinase n=1 Tax=Dankookia rubra TaxID=1442381 RepID=A0A4R5QIQ0_9PROT|nr:HWE histidine kinase domain-containing protein [Dankookia rubra]TDH62688.1 PAS domain-containing protein [Dankookia rubra]
MSGQAPEQRQAGGSARQPIAAEAMDDSLDLDLFRAAVEAVGETIIITGPELDEPGPVIEYVNPNFTRMTGYARDEAIGRSPRFLQGLKTERAALDRLRAAMQAGEPIRDEAVNYRKDGTPFVVEWLMTPVRDGTGRIVRWVSAQRDITERRRAEARQRRLLDEVNHRVNNTLAVVQSVATQTLRATVPSGAVRAALLGRLLALARAHELLAQSYWAGASLPVLVERQLAFHCGADQPRARFSGPEVRLAPGAAVALAMAFHELAVNASSHGALSMPGGTVCIDWSIHVQDGQGWLCLHWTERGGPPISGPPIHRGFGLRLIERGLAHELQAHTRLLFETAGLRCDITMPLTKVVRE